MDEIQKTSSFNLTQKNFVMCTHIHMHTHTGSIATVNWEEVLKNMYTFWTSITTKILNMSKKPYEIQLIN